MTRMDAAIKLEILLIYLHQAKVIPEEMFDALSEPYTKTLTKVFKISQETRKVSASVKRRGKTTIKAQVLQYLKDHPGSSITDIAEALEVKKSSVNPRVYEYAEEKTVYQEKGKWYVTASTQKTDKTPKKVKPHRKANRTPEILKYLEENPGCCLEDICKALELKKSTAAPSLSKAKKKNLVYREHQRWYLKKNHLPILSDKPTTNNLSVGKAVNPPADALTDPQMLNGETEAFQRQSIFDDQIKKVDQKSRSAASIDSQEQLLREINRIMSIIPEKGQVDRPSIVSDAERMGLKPVVTEAIIENQIKAGVLLQAGRLIRRTPPKEDVS